MCGGIRDGSGIGSQIYGYASTSSFDWPDTDAIWQDEKVDVELTDVARNRRWVVGVERFKEAQRCAQRCTIEVCRSIEGQAVAGGSPRTKKRELDGIEEMKAEAWSSQHPKKRIKRKASVSGAVLGGASDSRSSRNKAAPASSAN